MNCQITLIFVLYAIFVASPFARSAAWQAALVEQSDPAKLATLGRRGANPRVNRIVFYLHQAQNSGTPPGEAIDWAFAHNGTTGVVAVLNKEMLLGNYAHAEDWGLFTRANLEKLKRGEATTITKGWYKGNPVDVDHVVPVSHAPEAGNSLANLELQPSTVNRSKGADIGWHEWRHAERLFEAGIISKATLWWVRWVYFSGKIFLGLVALSALFIYGRRRLLRHTSTSK